MNSIYPLFCFPVQLCNENYQFTESEKKYINELEMLDNAGNSMSRNDRILDSAELANLKDFIEKQIHYYKKKVLRMKDENEIYITQSWSNVSKPNEFHPNHKHPNSLISGVLFFSENVGKDLPPIRFHRSNDLFPLDLDYEELNDFNAGTRWFEPVQGRLILFPSVVQHDVQVNKTGKDRITLSFNTFIRGRLGGKEALTDVTVN